MKHLICILAFLLVSTGSFSYDGKKHKKDTTKASMDSTMNMSQDQVQGDTTDHHGEDMKIDESKVTADLDDFPTIHPLIVHFPIMLLLLAALLQVFNIYFVKRELDWVVTVFVFIGVLTAWLAGRNFHPHKHDISQHAKLVLEQHELYADWTMYLSVVGLIAQLISQFIFKQKRWAVAVVSAVLTASAFTASMAGHHGAQLVHIEGIGPQGKYLEMEHDH